MFWENENAPDDPTYYEAYMNGEVTLQEQRFVDRLYNTNWLQFPSTEVHRLIPPILTFAREHPVTAGVLNNIVYGLRHAMWGN
jgi:hypothetical protein